MATRRKPAKSVSAIRQIPFVETTWEAIDPDTGEPVVVTRQRRGVLSSVEYRYGPNARDLSKGHGALAKEYLEGLQKNLREELRSYGFPTDVDLGFLRAGMSDWAVLEDVSQVPAEGPWPSGLKYRSIPEPLTKERLCGQLLVTLRLILSNKDIEPHLHRVLSFAASFAKYRIGGRINVLAYEAILAQKARARGPIARHERAELIRGLISNRAELYWARHPAFRHDISSTAIAIADCVNRDLREQGLLPAKKSGLRLKTIADYLRRSVEENSSDLAKSGSPLAIPE